MFRHSKHLSFADGGLSDYLPGPVKDLDQTGPLTAGKVGQMKYIILKNVKLCHYMRNVNYRIWCPSRYVWFNSSKIDKRANRSCKPSEALCNGAKHQNGFNETNTGTSTAGSLKKKNNTLKMYSNVRILIKQQAKSLQRHQALVLMCRYSFVSLYSTKNI